MFLTRKHLSRRTVLRGAGASLALPFLSAMVPAATPLAQTAAAGRLRTGFFYIPHGAILGNTGLGPQADQWTPRSADGQFQLNRITAPMEKHKHLLTTVGNLENAAATGSVHVLNPATWLSCTRPDTGAPGASMAPTLDQVIAREIGQQTSLPSLELASETTIQTAAGGGGYYATTLSFRDAHSPLPIEYNPRKVFISLFGEGDTAEERAALARQTASLLDLISERTKALQARLGPSDRRALEAYLDTVREIERRVERSQQQDMSGVDIPDAPTGELENFDAQVRLMFDLIALAYQADLTRVVSFIMVAEGTNRTYNHIGVSDSFHPVSHHANDPEKVERVARIQRYHMERFAAFCDRLASIDEGERNALENSLFLYGSNMSNSDRHTSYPVPSMLVGGAAGRHRGGKHVEPLQKRPLADLHLTFLAKTGLPRDRFADSDALIDEV